MHEDEQGSDKTIFVIAYAAMAMSGAFMGFLGGVLAGYILWG